MLLRWLAVVTGNAGRLLLLTGFVAIAAVASRSWPLAAQGPALGELPMNGAPAPPVLPDGIAALCGTPTVIARQIRAGFAPLSLASLARMADVDIGLPDGSPLWYNQYPRLIRADDPGGLRFENFLVVGDIETLDFDRWSVDAWDQVSETWTRTGTSAIDGHLVSRFDPSWTHAELWDSIAWAPRGVDQPRTHFGTLTIANTEDDEDDGEFGIWLEVAPLNLPEARVERINESTQYASHVVNLLVEDFGDTRLTTDNYGFDLNAVVQQFYEHFEDTYDSIAVVAADKHIIPEYAAFHQNVRNGISGLGDLAVFDNSSTYGSSGALRSVEFYRDGAFTRLSTSHHEIGHQWVDYWDWSEIAGGIERGGANPSSHFPLLFPGGTLTGGVLRENRRVAHVVDGDDNDSAAYVIEGTPAPWLYHPTTLYRMGLVRPEAVPELVVFENQKQFGDGKETPEWGTVVEGGSRGVHLNDILARHGLRRGPVEESSWRRATVVVSRDGLLSPEEMSYWNFYAARHAATEGVTTFDGTGSFFEATGGRVQLETAVTPKAGTINDSAVEVSHMSIDPREFRGVELNAPVPGSITVGQQLTVAGTITTTKIDEITHVCTMWERARQDLDEADDPREVEDSRIVYVCDNSLAGRPIRGVGAR